MLNENQNNKADWKGKLEELGSLPGETIPEQNVLWEKLHERLGGKKSNKKILWYWAAAACLLFALMIAFLDSGKENHQTIRSAVVQKQPVELIISPAPDLKKNEPKIIAPVLYKKNETITFENNKSKIIHSTILGKTNNYIHVTDTVSKQDAIQSISVLSQPADNILNITAELPSKKKLKVVHINELGDPVEESPDVARNADTRSFQFKLGNGEAYVNPSISSKTASFTIYKTKTSPN